ncbi:hypothetical protein Dimus_022703, partial [Dionaea muscipula]
MAHVEDDRLLHSLVLEQTCAVKHHITASHKVAVEKQTWSLIFVEKQLQVMTVT